MNKIDLLIIYLACGSPFGVFYFLQNRQYRSNRLFWLKTAFTFVMWLPFAVRLLWNKISFNQLQFVFINNEKVIYSIQKKIEAILIGADVQITIYDLREIFERYVGLTLAAGDEFINSKNPKNEFFRISNHSNNDLATVCYERRNRKRLLFHQTLARQDFLRLITDLSYFESEKKELGILAVKFAAALNDRKAQEILEIIFLENSQTNKQFAVKTLEKDLWKPERHKPLTVINPISTRLQTTAAATNSRSKD